MSSGAVVAGPLAAGEPFQPQDLVVTLLGTYVRPFGDMVWSGGLVVLLGEFGFSQGAARVALTRLVRRGLIERVRSGRLVHYRITPRCERLLLEGDGRIFSLGRARATTAARGRCSGTRSPRTGGSSEAGWRGGCGSSGSARRRTASGCLLTTTPTRSVELLAELDVEEFATLFRAPGEDAAGLPVVRLARVGPERPGRALRGVRARSSGRTCRTVRRGSGGRARSVSDQDAFMVRTRLVHLFREFPVLDPELPERAGAALGVPRRRAVEIFHALYEGLAPASQRHFDDVTGASPLWR